MIKVKVDKVKSNPKNPRLIKDDKFKKLVKSIKDFPEMETVRPIVVNKDMVILGGNMRYKAMIECGYKEVNVEVVDWSEQKQNEFIIKDNVGFGEWEWEMVANEWDEIELKDWGLDLPVFDNGDYSEKNKELDINDIEDVMIINLKYTEDEYHIVKDALLKLASTPEQAIWKLLGNE